MFISEKILRTGSWQAFERAVSRLLLHDGFDGIRLVGQTNDHGADIVAHKAGKRWLFQVKHWKSRVGVEVVDRTLGAMRTYRAQVPVVVALSGFDDAVREHQQTLLSRGIPLQLWDAGYMVHRLSHAPQFCPQTRVPRDYQEDAIRTLVQTYVDRYERRALLVMATGLGKTFTAAEAIRRINRLEPVRVLALAHTNELVYQLERDFWPTLSIAQRTLIWNGYERPTSGQLEDTPIVFACLNSVAEFIHGGGFLPRFDVVLIDECHHVGGSMYLSILEETRAGQEGGPFLLGLTATPWRADDIKLKEYFGEPTVCIDLIAGLKKGFLSNVDYRLYTDNINWEALRALKGDSFSPRYINRTLFITQWDDAVVYQLQETWSQVDNPKAIVFCGTIDHAVTMRDRINALGFCNASAIYSQTATGYAMEPHERNRVLCDFDDGTIQVLCAVDILNEGIDVPDVNIIVFQRVTHSRRVFIQQLGRGLRIAPGKDRVIVLDFVSDIRRFAAGIGLKSGLQEDGPSPGNPVRVSLPHTVRFMRCGAEDPRTETFLREWLEDVASVENAGEDASSLKFPPPLPGGHP